MKKLLIILMLCILFTPVISYAWYTIEIRLLSWDLVDSGKHMDWAGSTTYSANLISGVSTWNSYKSGVIRKDSLITIADVTISDVNLGSNGIPASTDPNGKTIKINLHYMNTGTDNARIHVYAHELGHTLGMDHQLNDTSAIMYKYATEGIYLNVNDRANYDAAYERY